MNKIPSFTIDHTRLLRGIYVSRLDKLGDEYITTFDIRMKAPNREPAMDQAALHTLEHLVATYLRNHPEWGKRIVYWGPMGCQTGNYLFVVDFEGSVPGATASDCGNYKLHNLALARAEAQIYIAEVLDRMTDENMVYPA